ncbi:cytochrome c maturation protein CcmE [Neobacillus notoginsengisoli]|uniref:Cytochrome c maturation protein CcmE n=1 Tax=Neobacillus notoginsengisoli TaxID=1578198 RepID=A0A417YUZ4_9BACI|nr:cytochrome c maturation protein CcmE [Neobacillus notoginsengisoli]RHW41100.1 cytochrome c maturation protein CcmE [Neobacillus notoginsengisoli]
MKKNTIVMLGGFIIAGAIVFLLMAATPGSSGVELKLKDLLANQEKHKEDFVTVEGLLIEESIKWDADKIELKFDVKDNEGNIMHVVHNGVRPDNFSEGVITILQGSPTGNNHFTAETVKTRCPSKYEGEDMENYDPEAHKEKLDKKTSTEE